ncbi:MAG TPA: flagellar motor switch protein FliG [Bryobacteraceae bacterium]|jgi:flagellar motor switch protein FliG|nr:flagellar motor switch protein FliG [Bryobacteraceae bacterium]
MTPTMEREQSGSSGLRDFRSIDRRDPGQMAGLRKAAILLVSLGREASSALMRQLTEEEVETVSREIALLPPVSNETQRNVLEEFEQTLNSPSYLRGGVDYARTILTEAFGPTGESIAERLLNSLGVDAADIVSLQKSDPRQLAKLIYNEHPQVIALILSHLAPPQAAALLMALPPELRLEVTKRMARLEQFSPEIVEHVASYIARRLRNLGELSRESYGGVRAVAEMLNRLDTHVSEELLSTLGTENETLSQTIRGLMFVFDDIRSIHKEDMQVLIGQVDRKVLTLALKGANEVVRDHFIQCLSQRAAEALLDDISNLGPVRIREVEAAQTTIIDAIRELQASGKIGGQSEGDKYIS